MGITIIIALSLAIGILITSTIESSMVYERRLIEAEVGADISLDLWGESVDDFDEMKVKIKELKGVSEVSSVRSVDIWIPASEEYMTYLNIIDVSTYKKVVKPDKYFFMGENPDSVLNKLKAENTVLIDSLLARYGDYSVGDRIQTSVAVFNPSTNESDVKLLSLKIVGIIRLLPGVPEDTGVWGEVYNLYVNIDTLKDSELIYTLSYRYLIDVKSDYDDNEVAKELEASFPSKNMYSEVKQNQLNMILNDPMFATPMVFLNIEYAFIIMIISIGLGLLMYVASVDRMREIAGIIARGASKRQIKELYFGETLTIIILSIIIGVCVGLTTAFAFNSFMSMDFETVIQREFILSINTFSIVIIPVIALIIVAYIVSIFASRIELNKILRLRGG
jgi:ABC-type lipoprotein release transport system permease subunit